MEKFSLFYLSPLIAVYIYIPSMVMLAASVELTSGHWSIKNNLFTQFAIGAVIGYALYAVVPAIGPRYFIGPYFTSFPSALSAHAALDNDGGTIPRNAMPSLHAAWSILCFLALRRSARWQQILGGAYVTATFITTLGLGLHYAIDWIVALPLVLLIRSVTLDTMPSTLRLTIVGSCSGLLVVWIFVIRGAALFLKSVLFIKAAIILSILAPAGFEALLRRTEGNAILSNIYPNDIVSTKQRTAL